MYDEQWVSDYCTFEGKIIRNDYSLGFLAQELTDKEKQMNVTDFFTENNWNKELLKAMDELGIESLVSDQKMGVLSGGERFKYRFLSLLARDPDVLLLDEPTNDLDLRTSRGWKDFCNRRLSLSYSSRMTKRLFAIRPTALFIWN